MMSCEYIKCAKPKLTFWEYKQEYMRKKFDLNGTQD